MRSIALIVSVGLLANAAYADSTIIPNAAATTAGSGGYSTLLNAAARSYQLVVGPAELAGIPVGSQITGIAWRRPSWQAFANWPGAATCTFNNYDITLSTSTRAPGSLSTTYTDNIGPDAVLCRSGPISFTGAFFPGGAVTPNTNPFSTTIAFPSPYTYNGGTLLLTVRHSGNNCGGSGSLDTVGSSSCQATGVSSYTQPDSWYAQGPIVMKLEFTSPPNCRADFNADGTVDFFDYLDFVDAFSSGLPTADFNADSIVDFFDYLDFVDAFSVGC